MPLPREETRRSTELLSVRGWLASRDPAFQQQVLALARLRSFAPKQTIYRVGDEPDGLYGVVEGSVSISVPTDNGLDYLAVRADPGLWIGDLALFSDQRRLVTVTAATAVTALFVSALDMRAIVRADPERFRDFYALTHENMALTLRLLTNVATPGSDHRLGMRLLQHDDMQPTPGQWLEYSQDELAQMLAMSLPTLQRALKRLAQAGMIEVGYARMRVIDRDRLISYCAA
ncbi:Crp/Fnr family transcriptional regulator [Palleronia sp. KMU-117]|uniref:Crp/Fnr family transcriptional regulator n=1 Tax=Palleronia sp. KMU-117 TaxID=3434108 RepID=UPI003D70D2E5